MSDALTFIIPWSHRSSFKVSALCSSASQRRGVVYLLPFFSYFYFIVFFFLFIFPLSTVSVIVKAETSLCALVLALLLVLVTAVVCRPRAFCARAFSHFQSRPPMKLILQIIHFVGGWHIRWPLNDILRLACLFTLLSSPIFILFLYLCFLSFAIVISFGFFS